MLPRWHRRGELSTEGEPSAWPSCTSGSNSDVRHSSTGHNDQMDVRQPGDDERFRDPLTDIYTLAEAGMIVVCPRCASAAVVRTQHASATPLRFWPRRLSCLRCAQTAVWQPQPPSYRWGGPFDPFFEQPLWLQASCCGGKTLWAFNKEHLDLIDNYVRARLRERGHDRAYASLLEKLPAWIKSAKHRDEITRAIERLRTTLPSAVV